MKTVAIAAAALVGAVLADSWDSWDPSTTTTTAAWDADSDPKWKHQTTTTTTTTEEWDPWTTTTTTTTTEGAWDPWTTTTTTTTTPAEWDPWTTTTTTTTTPAEWDPWTTTDAAANWATISALSTVTATTTVCPPYTSTGVPTWFSELPSSIVASLEASFTGPPADWCFYTPVSPASTSSCTATVTVTSASTAAATTTVYVTVTSTWAAAATGPCGPSVSSSAAAPSWTSYSTVYVSAVPSSSSSWDDPGSTWLDWTTSSSTASATASSSTGWAVASSSTGWAAPSSSPTGGSAPIAPSGNQWAMTYSPYTSSGGCTDEGTIASDIANIAAKGFSSVRVYSTDCNTLQYVGEACRNNGLKLILGIFISDTGISGAQQQLTDILSWSQWDLVELLVVGNEAVFNGYCSASDLVGFIGSVKSQAYGAGYTGPITTTEPLSTWQSVGTTFCSAVDCVAGNLYAFFNAQTTADQAGAFIQSEIGILQGICSGKDVYVMETGWPTAGECNGAACPGISEQATAINGIKATSGAQVVFFSYEDDLWKAPGQFGVEQHWGCADVFPGGTSVSSGWSK